ncbi:hypothetical protein HRR83_008951 [Exophiala dermatitidis]|uniref:MFS transporter, SP family, sugar:H+ symporter n=2 Tax=Exophiala dermatitidis TaxID=5970 RepID=H6CBV5_EXODN|nr:MFS transporter, SP family, sugar:H+ symporter [Exophiala dermatitidis NIH/UT8656]XP_009161713.1 MFS transporter, SP family, sugar:H+ symporter, variant [Exophiala dermatitidis NIH/UT8656]KAJ4502671.1 hypothetical protein HRR75_008399 [Exophiala dermatitidis]EHY61251.1 MFS transporter, SP family, sugar:H+ symporter, variant [Exophiala dermatitidis NIH/UT8656]EHY61252.1 MFS transporter, SP family, sugar:H+ symporter [Exophiala dermatitidis NIH/UT8656]KAJ4503513.1 hypothetical protein HRR73_0
MARFERANLTSYNLKCLFFIAFGAFFYGYDSGCTTSIFGYPQFISFFGFNSTTLGALGSSYYGGNFIGTICNFWLPDTIGRIRTIQLASVISILGAALQIGAHNIGTLMAGRVIGGFACGIVYSCCPLYASEISPPAFRGRAGGLYSFNVGFAYMFTEWLGLGFSYIKGNAGWRVFLGLQLICPALMILGSLYLPESPRWLVLKDRQEAALAILERIHGKADGDKSFAHAELHQIHAQIALEKKEQTGVTSIVKRPSYRKRLILVVVFMVGQQATAIIPMQNYQVILYEQLGFSNKLVLILVGLWGTDTVVATTIGSLIFDYTGRKPPVYAAMGIMTIATIMLTAFWATFEKSGRTDATYGRLAIFSMFLFNFGYAFIMNSFGYAYIPEILPTPIRAVGTAIMMLTFNGMIILLVQVTPIAIENISWRYFLVFIVCDIIFIIAFYLMFPETSGKPLEEIAALFGDPVAETFQEADRHAREEESSKVLATLPKTSEHELQARHVEGT